ncbi:MAG: hypothetical protein A3H97_12940 [Acidobacteria bacterium RIFCSPLOWO2_02_FULL_65_29]|nr:MAG: hypothetical protein A3H97_12940 [Acidobacteria bacterium RIFCSPLOWO2_02_FULL_65_29]
MSRDDAVVLDMLTAARRAIAFASGLTQDQLGADLKSQSAILHQLLVLGEAAKRLSEGFRDLHPGTPWKAIAGMRDRIIHGYDDVDLQEVWRTLEADLPLLIVTLEALVPPAQPKPGE